MKSLLPSLFALSILFTIGCSKKEETTPTGSCNSKTTCSQFATQSQAQAAYKSGKCSQLDADNDGEACESLPK